MRTADLTPPDLTPPDPDASPVAQHVRILIERLPLAAYVWDDDDPDVTWDDTTPQRVWDDIGVAQGFTDAVCDFQACVIERGNPDQLGLFPAGRCEFSLDNRTGAWSQYTADGRLTFFAPGRRIQILGYADGAWWWLFAGRVTRWDEQPDTVTVEAFDGFDLLAQDLAGDPWTPGTDGQNPGARITAIAATANFPDPLGVDVGYVALTNPPTDRSPLEEIQTVALSDGGITYVDADGRLRYRDRLWRAGNPEQPTDRIYSGNVCDGTTSVWDPVLTSSDDGLITAVRLANTTSITVQAGGADPLYGYRPLTHPDPDLWTTLSEGQELADYLLAGQSQPRLSVDEFRLYLHDQRQDLWREGIDTRLGDRIRYIHGYQAVDGPGMIDVVALVDRIRHEITPDEWVVEFGTSRTVDWATVEEWDNTLWLWDDPAAVWR